MGESKIVAMGFVYAGEPKLVHGELYAPFGVERTVRVDLDVPERRPMTRTDIFGNVVDAASSYHRRGIGRDRKKEKFIYVRVFDESKKRSDYGIATADDIGRLLEHSNLVMVSASGTLPRPEKSLLETKEKHLEISADLKVEFSEEKKDNYWLLRVNSVKEV